MRNRGVYWGVFSALPDDPDFQRLSPHEVAMNTYDAECFVLAEHFLADYTLTSEERTKETDRLARAIQGVVEDELADLMAMAVSRRQ